MFKKITRATNQEFFLLFLGRLIIESACLNNLVVDVQLETGTSIHRFFYAFLRNKPQNTNGFSLPDTMSTILGLKVRMRIPIAVEATEEGKSV
jgi:hypothetical protein